MTPENDSKKVDSFNADRSIFVQELIFAFLSSSVTQLPPEQLIRSKSTPPSIQSSIEEICRNTESINNESSSVINKINNTSQQQPLQMAQHSIQTANNPSNQQQQQESNQQQSYIISIQQQQHHPSDNNAMKTSDQNDNNRMKIENTINNPPISSNVGRNNIETNDINNQQRQKPMSLLMQQTNGSGTFMNSQTTVPSSTSMNNVNHRMNKVNKVRSSPAIVHHSTGIRHSSLHTTTGTVIGPVVSHGNLVVSPNNGRRKILRPQPQPTEPPPHYE